MCATIVCIQSKHKGERKMNIHSYCTDKQIKGLIKWCENNIKKFDKDYFLSNIDKIELNIDNIFDCHNQVVTLEFSKHETKNGIPFVYEFNFLECKENFIRSEFRHYLEEYPHERDQEILNIISKFIEQPQPQRQELKMFDLEFKEEGLLITANYDGVEYSVFLEAQQFYGVYDKFAIMEFLTGCVWRKSADGKDGKEVRLDIYTHEYLKLTEQIEENFIENEYSELFFYEN